MADLVKIENRSDQAVGHLIQQYKDKVVFEGLTRAVTDQLQLVENMLWDIYEKRWLPNATGAQLDGLGSIVGEDRQGRNDDDYAIRIRARIAINTSKGTAEDLMKVFKILTQATRCRFLPFYPAQCEAYVNADFSNLLNNNPGTYGFFEDPDALGFGDAYDSSEGGLFAEAGATNFQTIYDILQSVLAGGVRLNLIGFYSETDTFGFDDDPDALGFGESDDPTAGGYFAEGVSRT